MSDYTPTTEQVREGYSHDPEAEYHDPITNHAALNRQAFNRWLAEHDREVKAEAWDEGHWEGWQNATESLTTDMFGGPTLNPYREETE